MALKDLTGQQIQNTYQKVVQTDGINLADGTGSLLPISFNGNNVIVSGSLIAQTYVVSESVINVSSGSTIFGNSEDDSHFFSGSITASGDISSSGKLYGTDLLLSGQEFVDYYAPTDEFRVNGSNSKVQFWGQLHSNGAITASSNISASGDVNANSLSSDGNYVAVWNGSTMVLATYDQPASIRSSNLTLNRGDLSLTHATNGHITASGNISSSGNVMGVKGQFSQIEIDGESALNTADSATTGQVFADSQITKLQIGKVGAVTSTVIGGNITASGNISASGEIFSDNTEVVFYSFQLNNSADANTWYGPNSQGPYYYYWNKSYTSYPNTGLSHHTSGYVLPCKAELISTRFVIHPTSESPSCNASASLIVLSSDDFSYPLETAPNSDLRIFEPGTVSGIDTRYGHYEIDNGEISGSYPAGTFIYPRVRITEDGHSFRGYWELRYKKIK
jgi:hypothetical protein